MKKPSSTKALLTSGSIPKHILTMVGPMIMGILGVISFNLVDTYFVSLLGPRQLAALSFTFPVVLMIGGVAMGIGIGASAVVAKAIGNTDHGLVKRYTTDSLLLSLIVALIFIIIGLFTIEPVFALLGAGPDIIPDIASYMKIWYPGMLFVVIPMVGNSAIRATGDTKSPSIIMLSAMFINFIMDPILIFGLGPAPALGLQGAALSTLIARACSLVVSLWILIRRENMISFQATSFSTIWQSWKKVLYIGLPSTLTRMITPIGLAVLTRLVALHGPFAVGAYGAASRVETFSLAPLMALSTVIGPFVGQNIGADEIQRIRLGIRFSVKLTFWWGIAACSLLLFFAEDIGMLFGENGELTYHIALYLSLIPLSYGFRGIIMLSNSILNVINRPIQAAILAAIGIFGIFIPLAYLGEHYFGLSGIFVAAGLGNVIGGFLSYLVLMHYVDQLPSKPTTPIKPPPAEDMPQ